MLIPVSATLSAMVLPPVSAIRYWIVIEDNILLLPAQGPDCNNFRALLRGMHIAPFMGSPCGRTWWPELST